MHRAIAPGRRLVAPLRDRGDGRLVQGLVRPGRTSREEDLNPTDVPLQVHCDLQDHEALNTSATGEGWVVRWLVALVQGVGLDEGLRHLRVDHHRGGSRHRLGFGRAHPSQQFLHGSEASGHGVDRVRLILNFGLRDRRLPDNLTLDQAIHRLLS